MFQSYTRNHTQVSVYDFKRHFCLSDVDAKFLKRHDINMTVNSFKELVKKSRSVGYVATGNAKIAPMRHTKIYDINYFKK